MATKVLNQSAFMQNIRQSDFFEDWFSYTDAQLWTLANGTGAGTAAIISAGADGSNGVLRLTSGATDNDEEYISTTNELWKVAVDKPIRAIARLKLTPSSANNAAFIFGLVDGVADDLILDNEGGVATGKHGAVFYKPSGSAVLTVRSLAAAAAGNFANSNSTAVSVTSAVWHTYLIEIESLSSTDKRITYFVDTAGGQAWQQCLDATTNKPIMHRWTLADTAAGTGELAVVFGVKSATSVAQVLDCDYVGVSQLR